jgi:hypothetical protein
MESTDLIDTTLLVTIGSDGEQLDSSIEYPVNLIHQ